MIWSHNSNFSAGFQFAGALCFNKQNMNLFPYMLIIADNKETNCTKNYDMALSTPMHVDNVIMIKPIINKAKKVPQILRFLHFTKIDATGTLWI